MTEVKEGVVRRMTMEDIGLSITAKDEADKEEAESIAKAVNDYLSIFAATDGKCPKCGSTLGGILGSFTWGIAHGEGFCTGGFHGSCGWPCRAIHDIRDEKGSIFTSPMTNIFPYHPDEVKERAKE